MDAASTATAASTVRKVRLRCPRCSFSPEYHHLPVWRCRACGRFLPPEVRREADRALAGVRPLPILALAAISTLLCVNVLVLLAVFGLGGQAAMSDGSARTAAEGTRLLLGYLPAIPGFGMAAYAFWRGRTWGRGVFLVSLVVYFVTMLGMVRPMEGVEAPSAARILPIVLVWVAGLAFYLYRNPTVVAYYDALGEGDE